MNTVGVCAALFETLKKRLIPTAIISSTEYEIYKF